MYNENAMKNKRILIIAATIALILGACGKKPQSSSVITSESSDIITTSEISVSSETSTTSVGDSISVTSEEDSISSIDSSVLSTSEISSSNIESSSKDSSSSIISSSNYEDSSSAYISSSSSESSSSSNTSSSYSVPPVEEDPNWNIDLSLRGAEFRNALQTIMAGKKSVTISYNACLSIGAKAAAYPTASSSTFVPFYHDASVTATTGQCNREHTWPNSRGSGETGPGADPFIIRPTLTSENSDRSNYFYGTRGKSNKEWDPASCGFEGARGESARVILYAATMYYKSHGFSLSNNPSDSTSLKTMGTLSTLLTWNTTYAPTPIEIQVNNYLSDNGYGRNPFVDHPEYASYIWDNNGLIGDDVAPDPINFDDGLTIESSLNNLDGNEFVVASSDSSSSSYYYAMDNQAKDNYPWYIKPIEISLNDDKTKLVANGNATLKYYKFIKQGDGKYYIQSKETNNYLFAYIDGTHYSIGLGTTPSNNGSLSWSITTNGSGFTLKNDANVYLEYYRSSFCGYSNAPSVPIYLYH